MKKFISIVFILSLTSCANAYVKSWDENTALICCPSQNIVCTMDKQRELAISQCGGNATPIGGGVVQGNSMSGSIYSNSVRIENDTEKCTKFKCE